jgi:hypothetical protein
MTHAQNPPAQVDRALGRASRCKNVLNTEFLVALVPHLSQYPLQLWLMVLHFTVPVEVLQR